MIEGVIQEFRELRRGRGQEQLASPGGHKIQTMLGQVLEAPEVRVQAPNEDTAHSGYTITPKKRRIHIFGGENHGKRMQVWSLSSSCKSLH